MSTTFAILATWTVLSALGAMALRKPVHAALSLVGALMGVAFTYLNLGAEFITAVQVLVYVGAVAILIVFVLQLTRGEGVQGESLAVQPASLGLGIALLVAGGLIASVVFLPEWRAPWPEKGDVVLRRLGEVLMNRYVVALEAIGLLLTIAMIGAVLIALKRPDSQPPES